MQRFALVTAVFLLGNKTKKLGEVMPNGCCKASKYFKKKWVICFWKIEVVSSQQQTQDKQSKMLHAVCRSCAPAHEKGKSKRASDQRSREHAQKRRACPHTMGAERPKPGF